MDIENLGNELKNEIKIFVDHLSNENFCDVKEHIDKYFEFIPILNDFLEFRQQSNIIHYLSNIVTTDGNLPIMEQLERHSEDSNISSDSKIFNQTEESIISGRKMYRFERKIKAGCLPEINAYVPEFVIKNLNLQHNCHLYATPRNEGDSEIQHYEYELAKESVDPFCPGRVQHNLCLVEKKDGLLLISKSFETGLEFRINDAPYAFLPKEQDIIECNVKEGDLVDIAYPEDKPQEVRVLWVHRDKTIEKEMTEKKIPVLKEKKEKIPEPEKADELLKTLENKSILIIGNEPDKALYKKMVEDRGGTFLWADAKESTTRLEAKVKKSNVVIFLLKVSGHTGMDKIKSFCKTYNVPFLTTWSLGKSPVLKLAEEYDLNDKII